MEVSAIVNQGGSKRRPFNNQLLNLPLTGPELWARSLAVRKPYAKLYRMSCITALRTGPHNGPFGQCHATTVLILLNGLEDLTRLEKQAAQL